MSATHRDLRCGADCGGIAVEGPTKHTRGAKKWRAESLVVTADRQYLELKRTGSFFEDTIGETKLRHSPWSRSEHNSVSRGCHRVCHPTGSCYCDRKRLPPSDLRYARQLNGGKHQGRFELSGMPA
jgi:hypothetical protein